jgi:hypothetical protein
MSQLLLISETSLSKDDNRAIGDIVGVFSDEHKFSAIEKQVFTIVSVPLDSAYINSLRPKVREVVKAKSTDWMLESELERKQVWEDAEGNLKEVVEEPRFVLNYDKGAIKENYSKIESNTTSILIAAKVG